MYQAEISILIYIQRERERKKTNHKNQHNNAFLITLQSYSIQAASAKYVRSK